MSTPRRKSGTSGRKASTTPKAPRPPKAAKPAKPAKSEPAPAAPAIADDRAIHLSIPKPEVGPLPVVEWKGTAVVVDDEEGAERAVAELMKADAVGFDTETRPSFRKGEYNKVALMQVSTDTTCYLFRLNKTGILPCVRRFLEDKSITKIGLSIRDDFNMLRRRCADLEPEGFVELQVMVRDWGIDDASLQRIYAIVFGSRISKGQRLTNWEAAQLTPAQQAYASIDAWACLRLWHHFLSGAFKPEESPWRVVPEPPSPAPGDDAPSPATADDAQ